MKGKLLLTSLVSVILLSALLATLIITSAKAQTTPTVSVTFPNMTNSSVNEYRVGDTFRVNITVNSPDTSIWSWQAGIYFDNTILNCTDLGEGTFFAGSYTLGFQPGTIHNDLGYVTFSGNSLRDPETTGVNGTGDLMWFEFRVKGYGNCVINLTESPPDLVCGTKLNGRVDDEVVPISPVIFYDGYFDNTELTPSVGGIWIAVDKLSLLAPYIGLASTMIAAVVVTGIYIKRRRKKSASVRDS